VDLRPSTLNATWGELTIEFSADEISCRDKFEWLEPEHFKMKDQYTKCPTFQWAIFKILAMTG
jgi:hypothetical protein